MGEKKSKVVFNFALSTLLRCPLFTPTLLVCVLKDEIFRGRTQFFLSDEIARYRMSKRWKKVKLKKKKTPC